MKVAFFTARYSRSGVPLAQIRLANLFLERGYDVDFIVGYIPDGLTLPNLEGMNTIVLDRPRVFTTFFPIIKYLYTNKPDIIISAEDHLNAVVLFSAIVTRSQAKISVSSRVTPFDTYSNKIFTKRWFLKYFMRLVKHRADAFVCISKGMIDEYKTIFKNTAFECIYNVVSDNQTRLKMEEKVEEEWIVNSPVPIIVGAGRLSPEKGFPDLILSIKELKKSMDVRLAILGEGPMRDELEDLIKEEQLESSVKLLGFKENPLKYFKKADVFVLSSYLEGFGNVLVEAMMCGCTPVATNCPTGPEDILQNGKYGYIVPMHDPKKMAIGIRNAIENPKSPIELHEGLKRFTEDAVFKQYQRVLGLE